MRGHDEQTASHVDQLPVGPEQRVAGRSSAPRGPRTDGSRCSKGTTVAQVRRRPVRQVLRDVRRWADLSNCCTRALLPPAAGAATSIRQRLGTAGWRELNYGLVGCSAGFCRLEYGRPGLASHDRLPRMRARGCWIDLDVAAGPSLRCGPGPRLVEAGRSALGTSISRWTGRQLEANCGHA